MKPRILYTAFLLVLLVTFAHTGRGEAARGTPQSTEFAFGAYVALQGPWAVEAIDMAGNLPLDWITVEIRWSDYYPTPQAQPDWAPLDWLLQSAAARQLAVMLSITLPPEWALTPAGPEPGEVIAFLGQVLQHNPGVTLAVELFPGANTAKGWGALPDPAQYAALLMTVNGFLQNAAPDVSLVAGGLQPEIDSPEAGTYDDLKFLHGLYQAGIAGQISIISLQAAGLNGSPLDPPDAANVHLLRHYEQVRQVMSDNQHTQGLIWITRFSAPAGLTPQQNKEWLLQAYRQIRSQLYIGAVMFDGLNPPLTGTDGSDSYLIQDSHNYHPCYILLRELVSQNAPQNMLLQRSRGKDQNWTKTR